MSTLLVAVLCLTVTLSVASDELVLPLGMTKDFVCSSPPEQGYGIIWLVNGTSAASSQIPYIALGEEVRSEDGGIQRNITFAADIRANNTQLHCIVSSFSDMQISVDVNLTLQGLLPPPNVTYALSKDHHSAMFSWSAPFTLNISDMEPDILHYVVYIISDDGHNDTVITTDTHYELQADPCQSHQYHVEIAAVNVVGEGEKYRSPEIMLEEYAVVIVSDTTVSFRNSMVVVQITVEVFPHCHNTGVVNYEVELNATYSNGRHLFYSNGSVGQHTLALTSQDITVNEFYDYSVRVEGLLSSESRRMNLSTFDVQHVIATISDQFPGEIDITCNFAEESDIRGCKITAQEWYKNVSCDFFALRDEEDKATVTVTLPSGTYTLLVYDYEDGAGGNPAFTAILSVQNSRQVSECATVLRNENIHSMSEASLILIATLPSSSILIPVIATLIISIWFCKHKGKSYIPPGSDQNDYSDLKSIQVQPARSLSSESSSSSETPSGSDPLDQSSHSTSPLVPESGHSHYADVQVVVKHTMTCPPSTCTTEPVSYATLQRQDTTAHSNQLQGQLPGLHTTDDNN